MPPPIIKKKIQTMKSRGISDPAIVSNLKQEGHSSKDIYQGMEDFNVQPPSEDFSLEAPSPGEPEEGQEDYMAQPEEYAEQSSYQQDYKLPNVEPTKIPSQRQYIEQIEEIAEEIINEKWDQLMSDVGDINLWKEKTIEEIEAIKQEIIRLRNSFENLQAGVIGKVNEYNKNIGGVSAEMKALSQVFQKIMEPLTMNVKELGRITEAMKKK